MSFPRAGFLLFWCVLGLQSAAGPARSQSAPVTRGQLIGAWRLVELEYSGPNGSRIDPFYQKDSTGILIYDASGWMSVHIVGPNRRAWEIPASRLSAPAVAAETVLKEAAFDSYYAYFGTWELDPRTSVVTHRVSSALIPGETGLSYFQSVALEDGRLVLTTRVRQDGAVTVRRKIWVREDPV
jgi:hypothetical protein